MLESLIRLLFGPYSPFGPFVETTKLNGIILYPTLAYAVSLSVGISLLVISWHKLNLGIKKWPWQLSVSVITLYLTQRYFRFENNVMILKPQMLFLGALVSVLLLALLLFYLFRKSFKISHSLILFVSYLYLINILYNLNLGLSHRIPTNYSSAILKKSEAKKGRCMIYSIEFANWNPENIHIPTLLTLSPSFNCSDLLSGEVELFKTYEEKSILKAETYQGILFDWIRFY